MKAFVEGGLVGPETPEQADECVIDALFESQRDIARWSSPQWRGLTASYAWAFTDTAPRSMSVGPEDTVTLASGPLPEADVTFHCTAIDWIRLSSGKLRQDRAIATGRLKIEGSRRLAVRLGTILPAG